jgi:hypothetical protein
MVMGDEGGDLQVMSFLSPAEVQHLGGFLPQAIIAAYRGARPDRLRGNPAFVTFLHDVIRRHGPKDPALLAEARRQGKGWVYVIDLGTPDGPGGRVPAEDIVGGFEVRGGSVLEDRYWANPGYVVYSSARSGPSSSRGLVKLPPTLEDALFRELRALPPAPPSETNGLP